MWDKENDRYIETQKLSNGQTVMMELDLDYYSNDTNYWNIALSVYNKKKDMYTNMDKIVITGGSPFESFAAARKMFFKLLDIMLYEYDKYQNVVSCHWVDNRRRDVYYKFLSGYGFTYMTLWGKKLIARKFPKGFQFEDLKKEKRHDN